jgi:hypothetical protein
MLIRYVLYILLAFLCTGIATKANAQEVVYPGKGSLKARHLKPETTHYAVYKVCQGKKAEAGRYTHTLVKSKGSGTLLRIQQMQQGSTILTDTAFVELSGRYALLPAAYPGRKKFMKFSSGLVLGQDMPLALNGQAEDSIGFSFFDANLYDMLIRSLPLKEGYRAKLPAYNYGSGDYDYYEIRKVSETMLSYDDGQLLEGYYVEVLNNKILTKIWLEKDSRRPVRILSSFNSNLSVLMEAERLVTLR